jgi:hypothetical protein
MLIKLYSNIFIYSLKFSNLISNFYLAEDKCKPNILNGKNQLKETINLKMS